MNFLLDDPPKIIQARFRVRLLRPAAGLRPENRRLHYATESSRQLWRRLCTEYRRVAVNTGAAPTSAAAGPQWGGAAQSGLACGGGGSGWLRAVGPWPGELCVRLASSPRAVSERPRPWRRNTLSGGRCRPPGPVGGGGATGASGDGAAVSAVALRRSGGAGTRTEGPPTARLSTAPPPGRSRRLQPLPNTGVIHLTQLSPTHDTLSQLSCPVSLTARN